MDVPRETIQPGLCILVILYAALLGQTCSAQGSGDELIEVRDCRISLITRATLAGERAGLIQAIEVEEGDTIEAGQIIGQLRDLAPRAAVATADREARNDVDLRYAKKASELATLEYSKAMTLIREVPGSHSELDILKLKLAAERSVLQVEQAAHHLQMAEMRREEARIALESYRILAPHNGIVLQVLKRNGEALQGGEGVAVIANFDRMRVEGFIPVASSWRIRPGDPVQVTLASAGPQHPLTNTPVEGIITFIDPIINEISQEVRIWAEVPNRNHLLRDGMKGRMIIATQVDRATP